MPEDAQAQPFAGGWNRGVKSQIRTGLGRPRLGQRKESATDKQSTTSGSQPAPTTTEPVEPGSEPSDGRQGIARPDGAPEHAHEGVAQRTDPNGDAGASSSDEEGEIHSAFSGDDEAVMINLESHRQDAAAGAKSESERPDASDLESGELSDDLAPGDNGAVDGTASARSDEYEDDDDEEEEGEINESDVEDDNDESAEDDMSMSDAYSPPGVDGATSERSHSYSPAAAVPDLNPGIPIEIIDDDSETDPLALYASGKAIPPQPPIPIMEGPNVDIMTIDKTGAGTLAPAPPTTSDLPGTLTLADISTTDLQLQLRYYHIGRPATSIPLSTPVRCSVCAGWGHLADTCAAITCTHCGMRESHPADSCPSHAPAPPTVADANTGAARCRLCGCTGHDATQCERLWRTSAWPPAQPLPALTVRQFCYECGGGGHLGNDCPARRPGKGMGTSAWSARTVAGGHVPVCPDPGAELDEAAPGFGPGVGPGKRRRRENEMARRDAAERRADDNGGGEGDDDGGGDLLGLGKRLPKPSRSGAITIGAIRAGGGGGDEAPGGGQGSRDRKPKKPRAKNQGKQAQPHARGPPPGKNSNKRRKRGSGAGGEKGV